MNMDVLRALGVWKLLVPYAQLATLRAVYAPHTIKELNTLKPTVLKSELLCTFPS